MTAQTCRHQDITVPTASHADRPAVSLPAINEVNAGICLCICIQTGDMKGKM